MLGISSLLRALLGNQPLFTLDIAGADLRIVRFSGQESLSGLFGFRLELAGPEIDVAELVDKSALLRIEGVDSPRFVHGVLSEFEYVGHTRSLQLYEAELVPWIWRLQHREDCRIFQDKPTPTILKEVLTGAGLAKDWLRFDLVAEYAPRNYCVQYHESDLAFIARLMEEDGIFYYFEHHPDKHILVMADHPGAHRPIPGTPAVWFNPPGGDEVADREHVREFRFGQRVKPGKSSLRDFNLHKPDLLMEVNDAGKLNADLEVYAYPGEYQDPTLGSPEKGLTIAKTRLEAHQSHRRSGSGTSDCPRLTAGHTFDLIGHPRSEFDTTYRIVRIAHAGSQPQALDQDASGDFTYNNKFSVTEKTQPFRPPQHTRKPQMRGLQTATVVGPAGEEIYPDEHGRVKVQFHWDRAEPWDETSSCWVRVSQLWAGSNWGAMFIPRIGHEVLVDFIEGDPDRPVVVGRIYTGNNMPPYPLPAEKTRSTIKSESSLGGNGYNELRYEDLKGKEQIFFHAERNLDTRVNNDSFEGVSNDKHVTVGRKEAVGKAGDHFVQLYRDHHHITHRNTQKQLGGDVRVRVGGIDGPGRVDLRIQSDQLVLVEGQHHEHIIKDEFVKVDGSVSRTVGGDEQTKIGGRQAVEVAEEIHLKSPKIVIEAGEGLTIQGPGGFITIDSSGIVIRGKLVRINSGGSALSGKGSKPTEPTDATTAVPISATEAEYGSKKGYQPASRSQTAQVSESDGDRPEQESSMLVQAKRGLAEGAESKRLVLTITATGGGKTAKGGETLALSCGQTVESVVGKAEIHSSDGARKDVSAKIHWLWGGKDRGQGASSKDVENIAKQFLNSTQPITVVARVDKADAENLSDKASVKITVSCTISKKELSPDELLLARLIYAEAGHKTEQEQAAVAWTVLNRKKKVASGDPRAKAAFGGQSTLESILSHKAKGAIQYQSFYDKNSQWTAIDYPERLNCNDCEALQRSIGVAKGVLAEDIADPFAKEGGAFYMHLHENGVIEGERQYDIRRLSRKGGFTHYFWTYDPQ